MASRPFNFLKFVLTGILLDPSEERELLVTQGGLPITNVSAVFCVSPFKLNEKNRHL